MNEDTSYQCQACKAWHPVRILAVDCELSHDPSTKCYVCATDHATPRAARDCEMSHQTGREY